jgi:hypothetical protein
VEIQADFSDSRLPCGGHCEFTWSTIEVTCPETSGTDLDTLTISE